MIILTLLVLVDAGICLFILVMNLIMFLVGAVIFSIYILGVVWNVGFSVKKSKKEGYGYYSRHHQPEREELK